MIEEPRTHPRKPTITSLQASDEAKLLWLEIRDITSNEEAWHIIDRHLESFAWTHGGLAP